MDDDDSDVDADNDTVVDVDDGGVMDADDEPCTPLCLVDDAVKEMDRVTDGEYDDVTLNVGETDAVPVGVVLNVGVLVSEEDKDSERVAEDEKDAEAVTVRDEDVDTEIDGEVEADTLVVRVNVAVTDTDLDIELLAENVALVE